MTSLLSRTSADRASAPVVDVVRLDRSTWRVSGAETDYDDSRLIGYIERLERGRYEVLWVAEPIGWAYVDSFNTALAAVADRTAYSGVIEAERDRLLVASSAPRFRRIRHRTTGA